MGALRSMARAIAGPLMLAAGQLQRAFADAGVIPVRKLADEAIGGCIARSFDDVFARGVLTARAR